MKPGSSRSTRRKPRTACASASGPRCASPIARWWVTSATRSATITGTCWSRRRTGSTTSASFSATSARLRDRPAPALRQRPAARLGQPLRHQLRQLAPLGGLGRDLGALPAHGRHGRHRDELRRRRAERRTASDLFDLADLWQPDHPEASQFLDFLNGWVRLTNVLNELSRSMGQPDYYPFVLPRAAVGKLQFIHEVITEQRRRPWTAARRGISHSEVAAGRLVPEGGAVAAIAPALVAAVAVAVVVAVAVAQLAQMHARPRAAAGTRSSTPRSRLACRHQQGGCACPLSRSISIAHRLAWPHSGQRAGSGGAGLLI